MLNLLVYLIGFACLSSGACLAGDSEVLYQQHLWPYPVKIGIPVTTKGESHPFILATQTYYTFFDPRLDKFLTEPKSQDKDGHEEKTFASPPLSIGTWTIPSQSVSVGDLSSFNALALTDFYGVIGFSIIRGKVLELDFEKQVLEIDSSLKSPPEKMERTRLGSTDLGFEPGILAPCQGQNLEFELDTGNDGYIGLSHDLFVRWSAFGIIKPSQLYGFGDSVSEGKKQIRYGEFTRGELLDTELKGKPVFDNGKGNMLGMEFLVTYRWVFDFKEGWLYYQKRKCEPPIMIDAMLGLLWERQDGKLRVESVVKEGAGEKAGIRDGDQIVKVDGIPAMELNQRIEYEQCLRNAGNEIELQGLRAGTLQPFKTKLVLPPKISIFPPEN